MKWGLNPSVIFNETAGPQETEGRQHQQQAPRTRYPSPSPMGISSVRRYRLQERWRKLSV